MSPPLPPWKIVIIHLRVQLNIHIPESFIIITCVLLTMSDIGKGCQTIFEKKLKELFQRELFFGELSGSEYFRCAI